MLVGHVQATWRPRFSSGLFRNLGGVPGSCVCIRADRPPSPKQIGSVTPLDTKRHTKKLVLQVFALVACDVSMSQAQKCH